MSTETPTKSEVLAEIEKQGSVVATDRPEPPPPTEQDSTAETERELAFARLRAFNSHHDSKRDWSRFMMLVIGGLIAFQAILLVKVGTGEWDFTKYEWLLPLLLVQNLAQIVGLAHVAVKALFDSFKE
ncbi:hypothetical protein [Rhizobium sp. BK377]|uniref:hypothetical protein n=1 Tax=Rhizobium sp. BK377 TaxID=2587058 RepID=UPI001619B1CD|nr:hypothetical protein [Rhizobium sp. BK377]MBB3461550.1 hypothetical protein [Rhizobium sp. BK377]